MVPNQRFLAVVVGAAVIVRPSQFRGLSRLDAWAQRIAPASEVLEA